MALEEIHGARAVVIVGYGVPQTDSHAKEKLLEALGRYLPEVHLVLGPGSSALPQVQSMIQATGCKTVCHEQYAEDFLVCFNRNQALKRP